MTANNNENIYEGESSNGANERTNESIKTAADSQVEWKSVAISGTVGILLGSAATYAAKRLIDANTTSKIEESDNDIDNTSDALSFGDAWKNARVQLGPNGTFKWHDNIYSTATKEEWEATHTQHEDIVSKHDEISMDQNANMKTAFISETDSDLSGDDIKIIGIEEGTIGGNPVTVGGAIINGHDAIVVDIDHDGIFDDAIIDINDNHRVDIGEDINIQDKHISVDEFRTQSPMSTSKADLEATDGIEILGIEDANINGHNITVGTAIIDGHGSVFVDADRDGEFDLGAIDTNDNQHFEEEEIYDVRGKGISVESFRDSVNQHTTSIDCEMDNPNNEIDDSAIDTVESGETNDINTYEV